MFVLFFSTLGQSHYKRHVKLSPSPFSMWHALHQKGGWFFLSLLPLVSLAALTHWHLPPKSWLPRPSHSMLMCTTICSPSVGLFWEMVVHPWLVRFALVTADYFSSSTTGLWTLATLLHHRGCWLRQLVHRCQSCILVRRFAMLVPTLDALFAVAFRVYLGSAARCCCWSCWAVREGGFIFF